jgi:suppressor for copper-sensitivity B
VALAAGAGVVMLRPPAPLAVEFAPFEAARIDTARARGQIVLVKFTAAWCLSCRWVDATVYDRADVAKMLSQRGVLAMKADVTNADTAASRFLTQQFGGAPPLTVLYPPGQGAAVLLEGKFSAADLRQALDHLAAPAASAPAPPG